MSRPQSLPPVGIFLAAIVAGAAAWPECAAEGQSAGTIFVLITVDVESSSHGNPDRDIWGRLPGEAEEHGIERMMDIFDKHGVKGTFFVNVYEAPIHGEDALAEVCRVIHARGHDLELHTHPQPIFGVYAMRNANLGTQVEILQKGVDLLKRWTGTVPVAHRAGGFLANRETLAACQAAGIALDSSLVWGGSGTPLAREIATVNAAAVEHGVLEVPVTSYVQIGFGKYQLTRYLDIEASSPEEIRSVVKDLQGRGVRTAVIVMHSFSFSRFGKPNLRVERALDELVAGFVADPNVRLVTARELYEIWRANPAALQGNDYVPTTGWWMTYCRAWLRLDEGWKNVAVAFSPIVGFTAAGLVSGIWWFRRRRHRSGAAA